MIFNKNKNYSQVADIFCKEYIFFPTRKKDERKMLTCLLLYNLKFMSHDILFYFIYIYMNVYGKGVGIANLFFYFLVYFGSTAYNEVYEKERKNLNGKGNTVKIHTIKNVGTCFVVFVRTL